MELDEIYNNFDNIYTTQIVPKLAPFEYKRKSIEQEHKRYVKYGLISLALTIVFFVAPFFSQIIIIFLGVVLTTLSAESLSGSFPVKIFEILSFHFEIFTVITIAALVIFFYKAYRIENNFKCSIKKNIMPVILSLFGEFKVNAFSIHNKKNCVSPIELSEIQSLNFFKSASRKQDDDVIEGLYKDLKVCIAETELSHSSGGKDSHTVTDFRGLIIKTRLNKKYKGKTLIADKEGYRAVQKGKLEKVQLEDVEFESMFDVYSDNQVEARYLLDLGFMEKIKQIRAMFGSRVYFAVFYNVFYIFISSYKNYFEIAEVSDGVYNPENFKKVCAELISIFKIIEYLNLVKE